MVFHDETGNYHATVLADSIANGVRLTTLEVRFPRFILAELNTHRVFSRNSASSRAIPPDKLIKRVRDNPFVPATFNQRVKGMGIGEAVSEEDQKLSCADWLDAADYMCATAERLDARGLDKSRINRLLEPFMWHTAIITSTEWTNFMGLRCPPSEEPMISFPAQWEIQQAAILMRRAMRESTPQQLKAGWWHLPMITTEELEHICHERQHSMPDVIAEGMRNWCMIASRRLARVSFDKHTDDEPVGVSITKAGELASGGHFSPMEHVATPLTHSHAANPNSNCMISARVAYDLANCPPEERNSIGVKLNEVWSGNLRGWYQFRKTFKHEDDHSQLLEYEVM